MNTEEASTCHKRNLQSNLLSTGSGAKDVSVKKRVKSEWQPDPY